MITMKIYLKYLVTYYLVCTRIRPKSKPIGIMWLEGYGIKLPPDFFAYLIFLPLTLLVFTALSFELLENANKFGINIINVSLYILLMIITDAYANSHLLITSKNFFRILPISNWMVVKLKYLIEVLGWKFILLISYFLILIIYNLDNNSCKYLMSIKTVVFILFIYFSYCSTALIVKTGLTNFKLEQKKMNLVFRILILILFFSSYSILKKDSIQDINNHFINFMDKDFLIFLFVSITLNLLLFLSVSRSLKPKK